jgi:hypothetical protein
MCGVPRRHGEPETADVLLPLIAVCRQCHRDVGGARATCVECHLYHDRARVRQFLSRGRCGDGVEQDDLVIAAGAANLAPPVQTRADQIFVEGLRLPYFKFPRNPEDL